MHISIRDGSVLEARSFGRHLHEVGALVGHGRIFSESQVAIALRCADSLAPGGLTHHGMRKAFELARVSCDSLPSDAALHNWARRENRKRKPRLAEDSNAPRVVEMTSACFPLSRAVRTGCDEPGRREPAVYC